VSITHYNKPKNETTLSVEQSVVSHIVQHLSGHLVQCFRGIL